MSIFRAETTCPTCSKTFWYYKSWPRIYCSKSCSAKVNVRNLGEHLNGSHTTLTCDQCGKAFTRNAFEVAKTQNHFCSRECYAASLRDTSKPVTKATPSKNPRVEVVCQRCGKTFTAPHAWVKRGESKFCSRECRQNRQTKQCAYCGKSYQVIMCESEASRFCSKKCQFRWMGENQRGTNNPAWRGGAIDYYGDSWDEQRKRALERDNYTCQRCGKTRYELGKNPDVHHIIPFRDFGVARHLEANHLNNLISLCPPCHRQSEPYRRLRNRR